MVSRAGVVMIVSMELLLWCVGGTLLYTLVAGMVLHKIELTLVRRGLHGDTPDEIVTPASRDRFFTEYLSQFGLYALFPSVIYGAFYTLIPLEGPRAGLATALAAAALGTAPALMSVRVRVSLPTKLLLFLAIRHFVLLGGSLWIIGYLYSL